MIKRFSGIIGIFIALLLISGAFASVFAVRDNHVQLLYGKYVPGDEVIELRTEDSKTKWLGGDRYSLEVYGGAIHYKNNYSDVNETWKDIDLTFVNNQISKAPYILTVNPDNYSLTFYDKKTGSTASLALSTIGGKPISKITKQVSKGKMAFTNVVTDVDIEIVAGNERVHFKRILKSDKASTDAVFGFSQTGTGIRVTSQAGYVNVSANDVPIPVEMVKNGGLLTETVNKSKIKKYPVEIDPQLDTEGSASDGSIYGGNAVYATAHDAASGTARANTDTTFYVQNTISAGTYFIERAFLYFDTSPIDDTATIDDATLKLYENGGGSEVDAGQGTLHVVEGIQADPYVVTTYGDHLTKTTSGGSDAWPPAAGAYTEIILNVTGEGWINKTGTTKFCLRLAGDINSNVPSGLNTWFIDSQNHGTASHRPRLVVNYTLPAGIGVDTLSEDTVEDTTANVSGNVTTDNGETIEYYGFVWDTADQGNPGNIATDNVANGWANGWKSALDDWGEGVRTYGLTLLAPGTTYHFRFAASGNVTGWAYGANNTLLTKPAAPTNVDAADGTSSTSVAINFWLSTGATDYDIYRDGVLIQSQSDNATYSDIGADAPIIIPGVADATDGTSVTHVTLGLAGESASNGTTHTYLVVASNVTGNSDNSTSDTGYRGTAALTYQWQRSAGDADGGYGNIGGATTDPYNDIGGVAHPDGRYYQCIVSMAGAANQTSTSNRGFMAIAPTVTTGLCTGFGSAWAVVNGTITDEGYPAGITQIGFDYGTTVAYGSSSTEAGTYTTGVNYSILLIGLNPATVYHYRFKALNGVDWGYGIDRAFATEGSASLYENLSTGSDNCTNDIYSQNWEYQTFTTSEAHTVSSIWLYVQRYGSPGTVTASINRTSGGEPTGEDLSTATYNGNTFSDNTSGASWYKFELSTEIRLEASTQYAVVVRAVDGTIANTVQWCMVNAGGLADGNAGHSMDSGANWASDAPADHLVQIWGYSCIDIEDVKVFTSYQVTGDWLIVIRYTNIYPPYYDSYDVKSYFVLQFTDASGNVKAQVACPAWDYQPGSIYLSPSLTTALTYGGNYRVRLYGTFAGNPYTEYTIQATDWLGSDLTRLDSWVITSAKLLADYYDEVMTTYIADRGEVLNATGGVIFANGIMALTVERPHLFQIVSTVFIPEVGDFPQAGEGATTWGALLGPYVSGKLTAMGTVFGVNGQAFGAWILIGTMLCLMLYGLPTGHTAPANILAMPIFLMGLGLRLFDWATGAIMLCLMAFLLFYQLYFKYG